MSDYRQHPLYAQCTDQEKKWFDAYVETRDIQAATYHAYRVNSDESARAYAKTVMARKHISALIDEFCSPVKPLPTLEDLKRLYIDISDMPNATPREKLMALNSYERLCGFGKSKNANPDTSDDPLDDILE